MKENLNTKIFHREVADSAIDKRGFRKLYSDRSLVSKLDIVNELDGHSGCVNALSWSKSGNLLASGSDDQHLNIHQYQSADTGKQFQLACTVATGHTQNIFSTKFMPHSQDRTLITAAGDGEVRVFDLEYAGQARTASAASSMASEGRRRGRNNVFEGVKYLGDGDTDCRVYRSHGDRVKRIVTESSPYLFLTCSEDGEVRQWDLRQPSSAYPPPRGGRLGSADNVPPPLISYKRYNLDLNSISCSASQPHYIALGGAHLHAFLHDRRMAGRDRLHESGAPLSPASRQSPGEEELMDQATKCVRKFAPNGKSKMARSDNGHITALKISDARPNEMVISWSGDHIYSFDLVRSPAAGEEDVVAPLAGEDGSRVKSGREKKRKRKPHGSESSLAQAATARGASRPRTAEGEEEGTALRIRYQNGQQEDITLPSQREQARRPLTAKQREAQRLAKSTVKIRSALFGAEEQASNPSSSFSESLGHAASVLPDMDQAMRDWGYPMDPSPEEVVAHQTLRRNRESARRFVQAAGTLSRALGGRMQTPSGVSPLMSHFANIETRSNDLQLTRREQFGYDFLKAILLWLDSGMGRLIEGFTRPSEMALTSKAADRLPIEESEATTEAVDEYLIPYLLRMASDRSINNPESNRFEFEENRQLFASEKATVYAFAAAVKIPFADLSSAVAQAEGSGHIQAQDRQTATRYWASKVGRGVLLNATEGVNFVLVDRAFGGVGRVVREIAQEEAVMEDVSEGEDEPLRDVEVVRKTNGEGGAASPPSSATAPTTAEHQESTGSRQEHVVDAASADDVVMMMEDAETGDPMNESDHEDDEQDEDDEGDENDGLIEPDDEDGFSSDEDQQDSSADEEDGVPNTGLPRILYRSAFDRRRISVKVARNVHCSPHTRVYRGHCNVKTVKDVNFFGLEDEYVVSGSDDGNFFIWDRRTSELVNVLEGDGEVVNVVQGHPNECLLAVSGIDHTIKIFSPDRRAREAARLCRGIESHDGSDFSSLAWPPRMGRRVRRQHATSEPTAPADGEDAREREEYEDEDDSYVAPGGLASRRRMHESYQIVQQNDVERQGGNQDAFITRSMLGQLAARLRQSRAARTAAVASGGAAEAADGHDDFGFDLEGGEEGDDGTARLVLGDDCCVM